MTPRSTSPAAVIPLLSGRIGDQHAAKKEVEEAKHMIEGGEASLVIPRLLHTISKYPLSRAALDARYLLGLAYYEIDGYRDAIDVFDEYLRLAPEGRYADECAGYVAKLTEEYSRKYPSPKELDRQISDISQKLADAPGKFEYEWELADLLWKRGDYANAAKFYIVIVEKHPQYAGDETVKSRVEILPNGEYVVLSPAEVQRRQIEAQPLVVINQASFRGGRDLFSREARYYVVTGQVLNRGDSVLYGVQVFVTVFGFGNVVYDTRTVTIGRLSPGEVRAFSVQMRNFENIENIDRYECVGVFQR